MPAWIQLTPFLLFWGLENAHLTLLSRWAPASNAFNTPDSWLLQSPFCTKEKPVLLRVAPANTSLTKKLTGTLELCNESLWPRVISDRTSDRTSDSGFQKLTTTTEGFQDYFTPESTRGVHKVIKCHVSHSSRSAISKSWKVGLHRALTRSEGWRSCR